MAWNNGHSRTSTAAWKRIRQQAKRDLPYQCTQCGTGEPLELDHIINHKAGGTDDLSNLQWLCNKHHKQKTAQESQRARGMNYTRPPQPSIGEGKPPSPS